MRIVVLSAALILAGCAERTWSDYGDGGYGGYGYGGYGPRYGYGWDYPYYGAYPYWYSPYPYFGPRWNDDVRPPPVESSPGARPPSAGRPAPEFRRKREQSRPKVKAPAGAAERRGTEQQQKSEPPRKKR